MESAHTAVDSGKQNRIRSMNLERVGASLT